jgi:glycerol uptake facilitator-like aquaporin
VLLAAVPRDSTGSKHSPASYCNPPGAWFAYSDPHAPAGQTFWVTNPNEFENSSDPTTRQTVAAYVNEAVGTFFLCFTVALAADGHSVLGPLAIGRCVC